MLRINSLLRSPFLQTLPVKHRVHYKFTPSFSSHVRTCFRPRKISLNPKKFFKVSFFAALTLFSATQTLALCAEERHEKYRNFINQHPQLGSLGDASKGEIQIVPNRMEEIEQKYGRSIGIVAENRYLKLVEDPVLFPSGTLGIYLRVIPANSLDGTVVGAAVIPVLPDGSIALVRSYRHALRNFGYEVPRGNLKKGEKPEEGAVREATEETGYTFKQLVYLGSMAPDSGLTNALVPIYLGIVDGQVNASPEDSEAISDVRAFTITEIREGILRGYLIHEKDGKKIQTPIQDPFLTFGLFQADLK